MDKIALVVWTHSSYDDCWDMFFDNLEKYASEFKVYVFTDKSIKRTNINEIIYNPNYYSFTNEYLKCLENVHEKYILHMQEDFILFNYVNYNNIKKYINVLENTEYNFIRLIRSSVINPKLIKFDNNLYIDNNNKFILQATIWNKKLLKQLYKTNTNIKRIGSNMETKDFIKNIKNYKGLFTYHYDSYKRGRYHWDSKDFPYIATGICRGLWNYTEYKEIYDILFKKYKININKRGYY